MSENILNVNYNTSTKVLQQYKSFGTFKNNVKNNNIELIYEDQTKSVGEYYYTKIPLKLFTYNTENINDSTKTEFSELITEKRVEQRNINNVLDEYNKLIVENQIMSDTINELVSKYEMNDNDQILNAMKSEIINLRIQLGQGKIPIDFSNEFPFLPL